MLSCSTCYWHSADELVAGCSIGYNIAGSTEIVDSRPSKRSRGPGRAWLRPNRLQTEAELEVVEAEGLALGEHHPLEEHHPLDEHHPFGNRGGDSAALPCPSVVVVAVVLAQVVVADPGSMDSVGSSCWPWHRAIIQTKWQD